MSDDFLYTDQRYFHTVFLGPTSEWGIREAWAAIRDVHAGRLADETYQWGRVEHRSIWSTREYGLPATRERSRSRTGRYIYDIFGIETRYKRRQYVALGVPYVDLGLQVAFSLRQAGLLRSVEFVRVKLPELVEAARDQRDELERIRISKVDARLGDYPEVSGFSISGDNALLSPLYDRICKEVTGKGLSFSRCILNVIGPDGANMSVQCDVFGNFKVWVQRRGKNLHVLPDCLGSVLDIAAFETHASLPFSRAKEELVES